MAKKRKTELSKAEAFYIEQNWGRMTHEELAKDLGISAKDVEEYASKLKEAGVEPPKKIEQTPAEKAGFGVHDPVNAETGKKGVSFSTVATPASSVTGDEATKKANGGQQFINKRLKDAIHVIDPKLPCR